MIKFHVEITGLVEAKGKLNKLKDHLKDNRDVMDEVGRWFQHFLIEDVFATEGAAIEKPWPELALYTIYEKARLYPGRGTLVRTGTLQRAWQLYTTSSYALLTNPTPYAGYHDSDEPRSRLPQRKLIYFSNRVKEEIRSRFRSAIIDKVKRSMA